jgi:hypothetical protein
MLFATPVGWFAGIERLLHTWAMDRKKKRRQPRTDPPPLTLEPMHQLMDAHDLEQEEVLTGSG